MSKPKQHAMTEAARKRRVRYAKKHQVDWEEEVGTLQPVSDRAKARVAGQDTKYKLLNDTDREWEPPEFDVPKVVGIDVPPASADQGAGGVPEASRQSRARRHRKGTNES